MNPNKYCPLFSANLQSNVYVYMLQDPRNRMWRSECTDSHVFVLNLNPVFPHTEVESKHYDGPSHRYLECFTDW